MIGLNVVFQSLQLVFITCIAIVLFYASFEDLRYRTISKWKVVYVYLFSICYMIVSFNFTFSSSVLFLFSLGVFVCISLVSRGGFGMGDALVLGAVGWVMGDFFVFQRFLYFLGVISLFWGMTWFVWIYYNSEDKNVLKTFRQIQRIHVSKLRAGMVLAGDNFMHGLTGEDIEKLRKKGGFVDVKQPIPFIPVIFLSFLLCIV